MEPIVKQSANEIILAGNIIIKEQPAKIFINNHELTDIEIFF